MFRKYSKSLSLFFVSSQVLLGPQYPLFSDPPPNPIFVTTNYLNNATPTSLLDYDGSLDSAILWAVDGTTIDCSAIAGQTIDINHFRLPAIGSGLTSPSSSITILGSGVTIDGGTSYTGFSIAYGSATITGFAIQNCTSQGGAGGSGYTGGGGGTGGGGALYVHSGTTMTISAVNMNSNQAIGGNGGDPDSSQTGAGGAGGGGGYGGGHGGDHLTGANSGGGGGGGGGNEGGTSGGMRGAGNSNTFSNFGGAGGGGVITGTNTVGSGGTTAASCYTASNTGGAGSQGTATLGGGGGGGAGAALPLQGGGGGHGQNLGLNGANGGNPGNGLGINNDYGAGGAGGGGDSGGAGLGASGGGGGFNGRGGAGGLLGGGGGGSGNYVGGNGGFGAGGGAGTIGGIDIYLLGGTGGSRVSGGAAGGGGGSGLGGAIFIQQGGLLIVQDGVTFYGNSTTAGLGGTGSGASGGNGSSLGQDIFIRSGGSIIFQVNGTLSVPSPIEGGGSPSDITGPGLIMSGLGTVYLSGTNTYMGNTLIQSGTLNLNGSINGDMQIESSGTLSGNAIISDRIYNSGNISPGNSIGQVLTTDLYLQPTSIYNVEVNSLGNSDEIIASGIAVIDGAIVVTPNDPLFTAPLTYTILSANSGITGTFSSLSSTTISVQSLVYNSSTIELIYLALEGTGLTSNALNAASCFSSLNAIPGTDVAYLNNTLLGLSFDRIDKAFTQMGPAQFSSLTEVQLLDAILIRSTYTKHLGESCYKKDPSCEGCFCFWVDGVAQWQDQKKSESQIGYKDTTGVGSIGFDYCINQFVLGIAFSSTYDHLHIKNFGGIGNINSYYGGLYGKWSHAGFFVNTALLGAFNKYRTDRTLKFAQVDKHAQSTHNGNEWLGNFGFGYEACLHHFTCSPYINLDYVWQHENSYTETGAGSLDLQVKKKNSMLLQGEGGVSLSASIKAGSGMFIPTLTLAYINQTPLSSKNYKASFKGATCIFTGKGGNYERNLFAPGFSLNYQGLCRKVSASIYYNSEIGSSYWAQDVGVDLSFRF